MSTKFIRLVMECLRSDLWDRIEVVLPRDYSNSLEGEEVGWICCTRGFEFLKLYWVNGQVESDRGSELNGGKPKHRTFLDLLLSLKGGGL
jgi:hypothetical protein